MDSPSQTDFITGTPQPETDPTQRLHSGHRFYLEILEYAFACLRPCMPLRCLALFTPDAAPILCWEGRLQINTPLEARFASLQPALEAWEPRTCTLLEARVQDALPELIPLCIPLKSSTGGLLGLALFGKPVGGGAWTQAERALIAPAWQLLELTLLWLRWSLSCMCQNDTLKEVLDTVSAADALTGLLNRPAGRSALLKLMDRARQLGKPLTVCLLDINGLASINEAHGRQAGDLAVLSLAQALREAAGPEDCLCRMEDNAFLMGLWDTDLSGAGQVMHAVQTWLNRLCPPRLSSPPTFHAGLLELPPDHGLTLTDVLGAVDEKLYEQKRSAHIQKAGLLPYNGGLLPTPEDFDYDSDLLYPALAQSTDDYVFVCNMKTGAFRYPPAMAEEFGMPAQVVRNAAAFWGELVHEDDRMAFLEATQSVLDGRAERHCVEYRAKNRRGEWVWLRCRGHMMRNAVGQPALFAGIITNLSRKNRIDHLTGLLDKLEFESLAQQLLAHSSREPLTMMILGLDDLSHINSLYNRLFGDEVIRIASQKLQSMLPANAYLFRLDGDEFGVLIRGADREIAQGFYRRAQATFQHQQTWDGKRFFCTFSCGCAFAPQDGASYQSLVKYAHFALDHAKQHGKNRMCFFTHSLLLHRERILELTELLRESVEHNYEGFELYFQPVTDGGDHHLRGAEALCRFRCDKLGAISPVEFIPILEQTGLILSVGRWIFQQAVETCRRWQGIMPRFMMGINLSYLQLEDPTFIDFMERTLRESGITTAQVVVELTESYLASNVEALHSYLERLHGMNVLVSMDDFGTGYSSLGVLKQYPIDVVKIDRTFIRGIQNSPFDLAFIQFVADLCHKLGVGVVLEGVETRADLDVASPMGFTFFQGFYFGRPMSAARFQREYLAQVQG